MAALSLTGTSASDWLARPEAVWPGARRSARGYGVLLALSFMLALLAVCATTWFHGQIVSALGHWGRRLQNRHQHIFFTVVCALIGTHCIEIMIYAGVFVIGEGPLQLGAFGGDRTLHWADYLYFAAETYTTLGYGDIYPTGALRLISGICSLNGLLLLAWSGSFLFALAQRVHHRGHGDDGTI
jgi:hypothetical protein